MYYETHITMDKVPDALALRTTLTAFSWHYSCIDGDPTYGKKKLHYATGHYTGDWKLEEVQDAIDRMAGMLLEKGYSVIRRKIEMVMYDVRTISQ